jgi:uncharacterized Zn finger protein
MTVTAPPRARDNVETRGRRLLLEGRVAILLVHRRRVFASVRGDSGTSYQAGYIGNRWVCDCPARTRCAHLVALQLCVDLDRLTDTP